MVGAGGPGAAAMAGLVVDHLFDGGHAAATAAAGSAGAAHLVQGHGAVANQLADRAVGDSGAVADEHGDLLVTQRGPSVSLESPLSETRIENQYRFRKISPGSRSLRET